MLGRLLTKWLKNESCNGVGGGAQRTPQLTLQMLEAREVPAINVWIGASDSFNTAAYWTDGVPTADDTLVFTGPTSPPPSPPGGPPLPPIPPPPYSQQSVTFPTTSSQSYAGIEIKDGYTGTVTFPVSLSFGSYTQTTGSTAQYTETTLTVTSTFNWTGGAVNATTNIATYHLTAVPLGIIGNDSSSLTSGSKIVLDKNVAGIGSSVQQAGVLSVVNGMWTEVLENSLLQMKQIQAVLPPGGNKPKNDHIVVKKGELQTFDGETIKSLKVEAGGKVSISAKGLKVTDKVPGTNEGVYVTDGEITLAGGANLEATNDVYMNKGKLLGVPDGDKDTFEEITITGGLSISDVTVRLTPANVTDYTKLIVTKTASMNNGTFEVGVKGNSNQKSDVIQAKKFDTASNFKIKVTEKDGNSQVGNNWDVLVSIDGFVNETDIPTSTAPGYTTSLVSMKKNLRIQR